MIVVHLKSFEISLRPMLKNSLSQFFSACAVLMVALISFFVPSSYDGNIYPQSTIWACIGCIIIISVRLGLRKWQLKNSICALLIILLFLIFTLFSPLSYIAWGGLVPYLLLLTVLLTDIKTIEYKEELTVALLIVNGLLLLFGYGAIFNIDYVFYISQTYYQAYSEGLFESMNVWSSKPVTVFATHSISAIVYFALFCLNIRIAGSPILKPIAKSLFLLSSFGYLFMIPFLISNTSLVMFLAAILIMGMHLFHKTSPRYRALLIAAYIAIFAIAIYFFLIELEFLSVVGEILSYQGGGFLGRYTAGNSDEGGRLQGTYDFLLNNYFQPIGLTYSDSIALGDTFIAEYILKISIFGYGLLYLMLYKWLQWNVEGKRSRSAFLLFFIISDIAYPLLPYYRVIGFLPLFVILWNSTRSVNRFSHVR
jgi:hypothetical protein